MHPSKFIPVDVMWVILVCYAVLMLLATFAMPARPYGPQSSSSSLSAHSAVVPIELSSAKLPVRISQVESCSCWAGPGDYIQQKYKFRIEVDSHYKHSIKIDGGVDSNVRILVAYPKDFQFIHQIVDDTKVDQRGIELQSPPGKLLSITSSITDGEARPLPELSNTMGVPDGWQVWALAPNPHGIAQRVSPSSALPAQQPDHSFPTYVEKKILEAGESYYSWEKGIGVWSFNIPLPKNIILHSPDMQDITPRWWTRQENGQWISYFPGGVSFGPGPDLPAGVNEAWHIPEYIGFKDYDGTPKGMPAERLRDKHMRILGIGVFSSGTNSTLVGFSPVAPESIAKLPKDL